MTAKVRRLAAWGLGLALLLACLAWPQLRLELVDEESRRPLLSLPVSPGVGFALSFHHSYDRADCVEHYRLAAAGGLVLERLVTRSPLNGQGFVGGAYRPLPGGWAELTGIGQALPQLTFRLGSPDLANHRLLVNGLNLILNRLASPGSLLTLEGRWRPWWWAGELQKAAVAQASPNKEHQS